LKVITLFAIVITLIDHLESIGKYLGSDTGRLIPKQIPDWTTLEMC